MVVTHDSVTIHRLGERRALWDGTWGFFDSRQSGEEAKRDGTKKAIFLPFLNLTPEASETFTGRENIGESQGLGCCGYCMVGKWNVKMTYLFLSPSYRLETRITVYTSDSAVSHCIIVPHFPAIIEMGSLSFNAIHLSFCFFGGHSGLIPAPPSLAHWTVGFYFLQRGKKKDLQYAWPFLYEHP